MMAGLLLARAGIETLVLEKQRLRGISAGIWFTPTLEVIHELGPARRFPNGPTKRFADPRPHRRH
jgi:2-polyprenyl-6-methoxyphenol hydroxylase-like FAD-dependent oxidoreductase